MVVFDDYANERQGKNRYTNNEIGPPVPYTNFYLYRMAPADISGMLYYVDLRPFITRQHHNLD